MTLKKIRKFAKKNYFITAFFAIILFVGVISLYKLFATKPTYIYTKVKIGQGLWWASTAKPGIWLAGAIKKGDTETSILGGKSVEVLNVRYYPYYSSMAADQFDVYLTLKLRVSHNKKTNQYLFKRTAVSVGSPIELELTSAQVDGTVVELAGEPFEEKYLEKTVYLTKRSAYAWEFDAIKVGDKYFDGENTVFEILDKSSSDKLSFSADKFSISSSIPSIENLYFTYPIIPETRKYITVKAKILVKEKNNQLVFAEEQVIRPGKLINLSTPNFVFTDFVVGKIE